MKLSGFEKKKKKQMKISTFCYILIVSFPLFIVPILFSSSAGVYCFAVWIAVVVCTILYSLAVILEKLEKIEEKKERKGEKE